MSGTVMVEVTKHPSSIAPDWVKSEMVDIAVPAIKLGDASYAVDKRLFLTVLAHKSFSAAQWLRQHTPKNFNFFTLGADKVIVLS